MLHNLGFAAQEMGDYAAARAYYEQALAIKREVLGDKHSHTVLSEISLAEAEAAAGDWRAAAESFERGRRIVRRHVARTLPASSEKEQLALENTDNQAFHESLSLGLARRGDSDLAAASAGWLLNGKATARNRSPSGRSWRPKRPIRQRPIWSSNC